MARMRSLKPEFWLDRKLARSLSRDERMLYLGLWNQADEHGRAQADPRLIKGQVFPFDDDLTDAHVAEMLKRLDDAGVAELYDFEGDPYLFLPKLARHQRLEPGKVPSRHPAPPARGADLHTQIGADESAQDPGGAQTDSSAARTKHVAGGMEHVAGSRGAGEDGADAPRSPSSKTSKGTRVPEPFPLDAEQLRGARLLGWSDQQITDVTAEFVDYWRGVPGARGTKLDWPATWRNWMRTEARRRKIPPARGSSGDTGRPSWEL